MGSGDRSEPTTDLVLLGRPGPMREPLSGAVLAHHHTGPTLGDPETIDEHDHCSPATLRGQKFPSANSLSINLSSSASANSFFNRAFSDSSSRSRFASLAFMPPY